MIPREVEQALKDGAHLILSVSGGKDSDAMSRFLIPVWEANWAGNVYFVHADLGRMEWQSSLPHCTEVAVELGLGRNPRVHMQVLTHPKGDLIDGIWRRHNKRPDAPPFPSAAARWCTSDFKRAVIDKWIRNTFPRNEKVVVAMGIRAEESHSRAKKCEWSPRTKASAPTKNRQVVDWLPIHKWSEAEVWDEIGLTMEELAWLRSEYQENKHLPEKVALLKKSFPAHEAYLYGNERVSCALCVLASKNDLRNGIEHNPGLAQELIKIEETSGFTFRQGLSIKELVKNER